MLADRVYFATATTGTGTITSGAAETGFRTMLAASIADGSRLEYAIVDGTAWETGTGIVGGTSTTLTRVLSASSTGSLINLTGSAKCFITPIASRLNSRWGATGTATIDFGAYPGANETSVTFADTEVGAASKVEAYFSSNSTSSNHTANDHKYAPLFIHLTAQPTAGVGGTIYARSSEKMEGTFTVTWAWTA